jgi:hypothetical protein
MTRARLQVYADMGRCRVQAFECLHVISVVTISIAERVVILADEVLMGQHVSRDLVTVAEGMVTYL